MSNLQICPSLAEATGKLEYTLTNDCMFHIVFIDERDWTERPLTYACRTFDQLQKGETYLETKPVHHIGFLGYNLEGFTPEFYATYMLLNVKNHEIYSDKLTLSVAT